jgi:hypothetical protein
LIPTNGLANPSGEALTHPMFQLYVLSMGLGLAVAVFRALDVEVPDSFVDELEDELNTVLELDDVDVTKVELPELELLERVDELDADSDVLDKELLADVDDADDDDVRVAELELEIDDKDDDDEVEKIPLVEEEDDEDLEVLETTEVEDEDTVGSCGGPPGAAIA